MGKSSGSDRNQRKSSKGNYSDITRYSYEYNGSTYTHKVEKNEYGVDRVFRYVDGVKQETSFNIDDFRNNLSFNKKTTAKKKTESLAKFQDGDKTYDLNKIKKKVMKSMKLYDGRIQFVKFEKNYAGTYDMIYNSPYSKNVRMRWEDLKRQLN